MGWKSIAHDIRAYVVLSHVTVVVECRSEKVRKLARSESQHVQQNAYPQESWIINPSKRMYCVQTSKKKIADIKDNDERFSAD